MNICLAPELEQFVNQKVESGRYPTVNEVISDGLRLLKERDETQQHKVADLREALALGIADADAGKVAPLTDELVAQIKARGRQRLLEEQGAVPS